MRRNAGVTLIEMLIAVSLLGILSVGILFSLRVGLSAMEKTNARFTANRRVMGVERILEQELANYMPATARCFINPAVPRPVIRFFQGEPAALRLVTTYSIQAAARGVPMIAEFSVIPGENGQGVRLVVNEIPYTGPDLAGMSCLGIVPDPVTNRPLARFRPIETGPGSFVLADKLAYCRFLYREAPRGQQPEKWGNIWLNNAEAPSAIRVEMAPLATDPAKLQILPVTVRIRPDRDPTYYFATW